MATDMSGGAADLLDKVETCIYLLVALFLGIMALMTFFIVAMDLAPPFHRLAERKLNFARLGVPFIALTVPTSWSMLTPFWICALCAFVVMARNWASGRYSGDGRGAPEFYNPSLREWLITRPEAW